MIVLHEPHLQIHGDGIICSEHSHTCWTVLQYSNEIYHNCYTFRLHVQIFHLIFEKKHKRISTNKISRNVYGSQTAQPIFLMWSFSIHQSWHTLVDEGTDPRTSTACLGKCATTHSSQISLGILCSALLRNLNQNNETVPARLRC